MTNDDHSELESTEQRQAVRAKAQRVQAAQKRWRVVRVSILAVLALAVVAAIIVAVTLVVSSAATKPAPVPANVVDDGVQIGASAVNLPTSAGNGTLTPTSAPSTAAPTTAPVSVVVYSDYLDAKAATFQTGNASQLAQLVSDGAITLSYHPLATLAHKSNGTKYSLRAAGAAACVASYAPDLFFSYSYELMLKQPGLDDDGPTDDDLADLAIALGIPNQDGLRTCITNATYEPWVKAATERAVEGPLPGTKATIGELPLVLINGVPYVGSLDQPAELLQAVMAAESKAYFETASPSPSSTATSTPTPEPAPAPEATPATEPTPATETTPAG
ncbi:DsbA family protein [Microbacterium sp. ZW T5_56]|uniref:DsbA family protein n=1 Tax=Microbacterium sp. ZW T5_56 TaxID=3378081 RepID=UPI003854F9BB